MIKIISFGEILDKFGTEAAKENFIKICKEYYGERVRQEATEQIGQAIYNSRRAELHNKIMEVVQKLSHSSKDLMPSRKEVGKMIMDYFRNTI